MNDSPIPVLIVAGFLGHGLTEKIIRNILEAPASLPRLQAHMSELLPITVLSGFLGSGKTTLLRRWRRDEALRDANPDFSRDVRNPPEEPIPRTRDRG